MRIAAVNLRGGLLVAALAHRELLRRVDHGLFGGVHVNDDGHGSAVGYQAATEAFRRFPDAWGWHEGCAAVGAARR